MAYFRNPVPKFSGPWNKTGPKGRASAAALGYLVSGGAQCMCCCLACVSTLSFCVYECVLFIIRLITLNLPDQNTALCSKVVAIVLCCCIFKKLIWGLCPTSDDFACKQYKLLVERRSFLSYLVFMCHQKCAYKLKGDVHRLWVWIGGVGGSWQNVWVSEAGEEIFNHGVTNLMR